MQIKTILVPCDFSEYAEYAFTWALGLAERWGAKLILLHAAPLFTNTSDPGEVFLLDYTKIEKELLADAEKRLTEFSANKGPHRVPVAWNVRMPAELVSVPSVSAIEQPWASSGPVV